jgi:hypothetical protein
VFHRRRVLQSVQILNNDPNQQWHLQTKIMKILMRVSLTHTTSRFVCVCVCVCFVTTELNLFFKSRREHSTFTKTSWSWSWEGKIFQQHPKASYKNKEKGETEKEKYVSWLFHSFVCLFVCL